ncbi:MAG: 50S ribosomal protein L19 [Candidatus Latescibacterota bacterium]|jgi:large subunit ribosomal protein L19
MNVIDRIERKVLEERNFDFNVGDTVRIMVRVVEGNKEREQAFQGVVIKKRGGGAGQSFTVRKISSGIGVERVFPAYSPNIKSVKVIRRGKVRRSKLYYLRDRVGKAARIKESKRS